MTKAEQLVRQEIRRLGPLPFSKFVELALYHPLYGYYNRKTPQRGKAGDYFTSMQVSSIFPRICARLFSSMKEALGCDQFALIEIGSGDGEFLEGVLHQLNIDKQARGFRVWAVERSRPARDKLVKRLSRFDRCQVIENLDQVEWMGTLEGCIFSNEFFDALPFDRYRFRNGQWREQLVGEQDGALVEMDRDIDKVQPTEVPTILADEIASGHRMEFRPQIAALFEEWGALLSRGYALTIDYGHPREIFLSGPRADGTAMAYFQHTASQALLERVGEQDLTAHVDFTQLVEAGQRHGWRPDFFSSQGVLLSTVGETLISEFLAGGPEDQRHNRAAVVRQLIHPSAMGEKFWALLQSKDAPLPTVLTGLPNRIKRLI